MSSTSSPAPGTEDEGPRPATTPGTAGATPGTADAPASPGSMGGAPPPPAGGRRGPWTAGRVVLVALGAVLLLIAGVMLAGGTALALSETRRDHDGFLMSRAVDLRGPWHAVVSEPIRVEVGTRRDTAARLVGDVKIEAASRSGAPVFVGIGPSADVDTYLAGVGHSTVTGLGPSPRYRDVAGLAPMFPPTDVPLWTVAAAGPGTQAVTWPVESGDWTVVVMNADGGAPVDVQARGGATVPILRGIMVGLFGGGALLLLVALGLILVPVLTAGSARAGSPPREAAPEGASAPS